MTQTLAGEALEQGDGTAGRTDPTAWEIPREDVPGLGAAFAPPMDVTVVTETNHFVTGGHRSVEAFLNHVRRARPDLRTRYLVYRNTPMTPVQARLLARRTKRLVINGLASLVLPDIRRLMMWHGRPAYIYLHETAWTVAVTEDRNPNFALSEVLGDHTVLCVSHRQEAWIRGLGARRTAVVYETVPPLPPGVVPCGRTEPLDGPVEIVMVGTVQRRKGMVLFGEVADLAKRLGLPWHFSWIGSIVDGAVPRSSNVTWHGLMQGEALRALQAKADVLFLSSIDDPFPLAVLEMMQLHKRVVCFRNSGSAEIADGVPGCAVFEEHTPEAALEALRRSLSTPLDVAAIQGLVDGLIDVGAFGERFLKALGLA